MVMQTTTLECGRELAGVVGRQNDPGLRAGNERTDLGNGDLLFGENLQEQCFHRLLGAVHLVDQKYYRIG